MPVLVYVSHGFISLSHLLFYLGAAFFLNIFVVIVFCSCLSFDFTFVKFLSLLYCINSSYETPVDWFCCVQWSSLNSCFIITFINVLIPFPKDIFFTHLNRHYSCLFSSVFYVASLLTKPRQINRVASLLTEGKMFNSSVNTVVIESTILISISSPSKY